MNPWTIIGAVAIAGSLAGWALLERVEVYRLRAENVTTEEQRRAAVEAAERNFQMAKHWRELRDQEAALAREIAVARDEALERVLDAEEEATRAAREAEREVTVYVQDIARIRMPCGLVRLLDAAADDSAGAGTSGRRAELSAAAGCAGAADTDLARIGYDALVSGFIWLAADRRAAKTRAAGMSGWFDQFWRDPVTAADRQ